MSSHQSFSHWLLQVLVVSGLLVFFLWLSLRPSTPAYTILDFSVRNATTDAVSFGLEASNDNRVGSLYYGNINVTLYLGNRSIGTTRVPSFSQGHETATEVTGSVTVGGRLLKEVVRAVGNGSAEMKMGLATTVRYRIWRWRSKVHRMAMEASVEIGRGGKMSRKRIKMRRKNTRKLLS